MDWLREGKYTHHSRMDDETFQKVLDLSRRLRDVISDEQGLTKYKLIDGSMFVRPQVQLCMHMSRELVRMLEGVEYSEPRWKGEGSVTVEAVLKVPCEKLNKLSSGSKRGSKEGRREMTNGEARMLND